MITIAMSDLFKSSENYQQSINNTKIYINGFFCFVLHLSNIQLTQRFHSVFLLSFCHVFVKKGFQIVNVSEFIL